MSPKLKPFIIRLLTTYYLLLTTVPPAHAQIDLGDAFKLNDTDTVASTFPSITDIISTILPNVYIGASVILFFILIGAGIAIIASSDNPEAKDKGKQALTAAIIGFVIIFTSFWIIQIVETIAGITILDLNITTL